MVVHNVGPREDSFQPLQPCQVEELLRDGRKPRMIRRWVILHPRRTRPNPNDLGVPEESFVLRFAPQGRGKNLEFDSWQAAAHIPNMRPYPRNHWEEERDNMGNFQDLTHKNRYLVNPCK